MRRGSKSNDPHTRRKDWLRGERDRRPGKILPNNKKRHPSIQSPKPPNTQDSPPSGYPPSSRGVWLNIFGGRGTISGHPLRGLKSVTGSKVHLLSQRVSRGGTGEVDPFGSCQCDPNTTVIGTVGERWVLTDRREQVETVIRDPWTGRVTFFLRMLRHTNLGWFRTPEWPWVGRCPQSSTNSGLPSWKPQPPPFLSLT